MNARLRDGSHPTMRTSRFAALLMTVLAGCGARESTRVGDGPTAAPSVTSADAPRADAALSRTISIVGTNDLHGRVLALPVLGGYVENLRRAADKAGGGVVLVDAGDMFQGTLESNLLEGKPVRDAYGVLGYAAATVGNHEFDYGPIGSRATPRSAADDPRGALKALAKSAPFPFLIANIRDSATKRRVDYPNMPASTVVTVRGIPIGIVGVTTEDTLTTTISSNVKDLEMESPTKAIVREATALRAAGARAVVVLAHAGGKCKHFTNDVAADHCESSSEIFRIAKQLPAGAVDVIVAGHTHAGLAHTVAGIPIIEQFSYGKAFGRVDLTFTGDPPVVSKHEVHPPRELCPGVDKPDFATCTPGHYEGAPVVRSEAVTSAIMPGVVAAKDKRSSKIGKLSLREPVTRSYTSESALGNLFADMILEGAPGADIALMNGGGLREDLPAGDLTYGALFESFPFDNQMATARVPFGDLERIVVAHVKQGGGVLSLAGVRVKARCKNGEVDVILERTTKGRPWKDTDTIVVAASDFMMLGGDAFWADVKPPQVEIGEELVRDVIDRGLQKRTALDPDALFDPDKRRLDLAKPRPMKCK